MDDDHDVHPVWSAFLSTGGNQGVYWIVGGAALFFTIVGGLIYLLL